MLDIILENLIKILTALVLTLISVGGTWLTVQLGKRQELGAITAATQNVIDATMLTAAELQQTAVEALKNAAEDGKLSNDDIMGLNQQLLAQTKEKLSVNVYDLINAAGADIEAIILGAGEAWVQSLKGKG